MNHANAGVLFARMNKVVGRTDDMLIIRGVNVFPSQIESVLIRSPHIGPHYPADPAEEKLHG